MLKKAIVLTVNSCTRNAWTVIIVAALATFLATIYAIQHFAINTDINTLISKDLDWRKRELAFEAAFPQRNEMILAVVDAPTSELATQATAALIQKLSTLPNFHSIQQLGGGEFFNRNGLLFLPTKEVEERTQQLDEAQPLIEVVASDPSLRGLGQALSLALAGVQRGQLKLDDMVRPLTTSADTIESVMAGRRANFSWNALMKGDEPVPASELRRFIDIRPILDYSALEPGHAAITAIRQAAKDLNFASEYNARVRLTGPVPIADEEYATVNEGALVNSLATVAIVLLILWLALRSFKIILAVALSLVVSLAVTAGLGFLLVGSLNLISIAFAVLCVGLGVDFGIQFSVRYRAERYEVDNLRVALSRAARHVGTPLTLAAAATAAGFFSFLPTDYRGVSELGQIAGVGMMIAFVTSITVLPALLKVLNPPGEPEPLGYNALAPIDRFTERYRTQIIVVTALVIIAGLPLLYWVRFDFNPIHLRSPKVESVATFLDLRSDPTTGANSINALMPSLAAAKESAERLSKLPEVSRVMTLETFIPDDQEKKLELIRKTAEVLNPSLSAENAQKPPTDAENIAAINKTAASLNEAAEKHPGPGAAAAKRLASALIALAKADQQIRSQVQATFVSPLSVIIDQIRDALQAQPITAKNLPEDISQEWLLPDGRARVEALPAGDPNDNETLRAFARAVLAVEPNAVGGPISILESGRTIVTAFFEAGIWALISITILLWITLRRFGDVLLTLIPLLTAAVVTLQLCVILGMPLNFANIVALPLMLGIGVAFKIYYVMAWRAGQTDLLQSSLTRAVFYSALTTAAAFGSLWFSSHPGTSSMGKLLALSLMCTLAAAVLFQPLLMGPPREEKTKD